MRPYPRSWYAATLSGVRERPRLLAQSEAEVCVIGGGLAGITTALELARRGKSVVLVEANRLGWGASGRNGGFVSPGFALGVEAIIERAGLAAARELYALSLEGHHYVRCQAAALSPRTHMGEGWIVALRHPDPDGLAAHRDLLAGSFGVESELWNAERTRSVLKSSRYGEGLFMASAFHIHPLNYLLALSDEAERLGVRIFEASPALSLEREGTRHAVTTSHAKLLASHVVCCISAYDRNLLPALGRAVLPVATYIGVTEPFGERVSEAIATPAAISDTRRAGDYYRVIEDGRILWGGRITTRVSEPARLAEMMRRDMLAVYPQLAHRPGRPGMDYAWGGLMGYARHKMPVIGRAGDGLWMAAGFGGHGLNTTAMAGLMIARAIADGDDRVRLFAPFGAPWVGGPFGRMGVQVSYWAMQLKDRWDEAKAARQRPPLQ